jgi:hypothetical protein
MRLSWFVLPAVLLPCAFLAFVAEAQTTTGKPPKISWKKIVIDKNFRSEGVGVADVNKDGKLDIIVGDCWYEAPKEADGEWQRHILRGADRKFDPLVYSDSFCCFPGDFNGDGWPDVIVIPFPGNPCYWYENPGAKGGPWTPHLLTNSACNETPIYVDLFKSGTKVLVMGWNPQKDENDLKKGNFDDRGELCYFTPGRDPTQPWTRVSLSGPSAKGKTIPGTQRFAHGLGCGDVNGDGRFDIIVPQGWWEQPEKADGTPWKFHAANISAPCANMYAVDIDGDGKADIVSTSAHNYGFWWSQQKDAKTFVPRPFFQPPSEVAKLPADLRLSAEEKALHEAVKKGRSDAFMAPFAVDPQLCDLARRYAMVRALGLKVDFTEADVRKAYTGKLVSFGELGYLEPADLGKLVLSLKGNPKVQDEFMHPRFEIGVGAQKANDGKVFYVLLVGDRGKFSLPSQAHALQHIDIDGDGLKDFVTGRRWWAHGPKGDAGPNDPAYLYWFQAKRGKDGMLSFTPHLIDDDSGIGTQFAVEDMNGDGLLDVIISNKKGVFLFLQVREKE